MLHLEPVAKIRAHMISAEGQHCHGIAANLADIAIGRGSHLRAHCGPDVNAGAPVERLIYQRHQRGAAATENNGTDRHPIGAFPRGIDGGALGSRRRETRIRVSRLRAGLLRNLRGPSITLPVQTLGGWIVGHPFPPHAAFRRERYVRENGVSRQRRHRVRVGFDRRPWSHAKESGLRIDGSQLSVLVGSNPCDVIAHRPYFPAFEPLWRNHHGEVGLAAGAWECRRDIGFLTLGILDSDNEHMLRHPTFVTRYARGDSQREAFLSQKGVASIPGAVRPDLAGLREMDDVFLWMARPGDVFLAAGERPADTVDARHYGLLILVDFPEDTQANASHDAHIHYNVGRIGELHSDLRHG